MKRIMIVLLYVVASAIVHAQSNPILSKGSGIADIPFDAKLDNPSFKICDEKRVLQYYSFGLGFQYKGDKPALIEHFRKGLTTSFAEETGYITIRFIVNCEGRTGRFRIQEMDIDYHPMKFSPGIVDSLLDLTRQLDGWPVHIINDHKVDYYQWLSFKIERGQVKEILP